MSLWICHDNILIQFDLHGLVMVHKDCPVPGSEGMVGGTTFIDCLKEFDF